MEGFRSQQRCGIGGCRERRFFRAEDGFVYCRRGHQSDVPFETFEDDTDLRAATRRVTRLRKDDDDASQKEPAELQGREAAELFLKCCQLILRKQIRWLIQQKALPHDLESVARDLWTLRLSSLEPLMPPSSDSLDNEALYSSQTSTSSSESSKKHTDILVTGVRFQELLCIVHLGLLLLRYPICTGDLHQWLSEDGFIYLRPQIAVSRATMKMLPENYRRVIKVGPPPPDPGTFHRCTMSLASTYQQPPFSMGIPPLNHHLLLLRLVTELSLPLDIFTAVENLKDLLGYSFALGLLNQQYRQLVNHPELQLVALVVISVKLYHPFDRIVRYPHKASEPSSLVIDWAHWNTSHRQVATSSSIVAKSQNQKHWDLEENEILRMDGEQLDEYMDWFQKTWCLEDNPAHGPDPEFRKELFNLFRLDKVDIDEGLTRQHGSEVYSKLHDVLNGLKIREPVTELGNNDDRKPIRRPGDRYQQYRHPQDIPEIGKSFFQMTAALMGVSLEQLLQVVSYHERRLDLWTEAQKKHSRQEE